jgi:predicted membrane protein
MKQVVKSSIIAWSIFGVVVGLAISLSIDFMMGDTFGSGWHDSVKHDINLWLGPEWADRDWFVYISIVTIIGGIGIIGGLMGAVFGAVIGKIFSLMSR